MDRKGRRPRKQLPPAIRAEPVAADPAKAEKWPLKVGTHGGVFHADDVFACAVLCELVTEPAAITRARTPHLLAEMDILVDVGGEYDPTRGRFDHHQTNGAGERPGQGFPYASFGLVWKAYGARLVREAYGITEEAEVEAVVNRVDVSLVSIVDGVDCGTFRARGFGVNAVFSCLNPTDDEETDFDQAFFEDALPLARKLLRRVIKWAIADHQAVEQVREAMRNTRDKRLLELERGVSWKETVMGEFPDVLFVVYPLANHEWRLQVVQADHRSYRPRKALPVDWWGLMGVDFEQATKVQDAVFCHPNGYIAGARSREGVMRLAELALAW